MKRITISLPEELATAVERVAQRDRSSVSEVVRQAIEERLGRAGEGPRELPFANLGRSGYSRRRRTWKPYFVASGAVLAVPHAGPLYAAADAGDRHHHRSLQVLQRRDVDFVIPALVIAEVTCFVGGRLGAAAEAQFVRGLAGFHVEAPTPAEWALIGDLVERYADFPLGAADASVAVLADRLKTDVIITVDRRHFSALRTPAGAPYRLLPE